MNTLKRISQVFETAEKIAFDDSSRIVLMSDCHRSDGGAGDDFAPNRNLYQAALTYYYHENYIYIEIGDGDELWEKDSFSDIVNVHSDIFGLLTQFYRENRLYFIFGNHDMVKSDNSFVESNLYRYFDKRTKRYIPLFNGIKIHEGLVLRHTVTGGNILLIHGHQVDFLNYDLWRLARFLVRYLWRPLESIGINDPTSAAKNYKKKAAVEEELIKWIKKEKHMLIAGHTHKPRFSEVGETPYFNDGSLVLPNYITAIEIAAGDISLVKWSEKTNDHGSMSISREVLAGPRRIAQYFTM